MKNCQLMSDMIATEILGCGVRPNLNLKGWCLSIHKTLYACEEDTQSDDEQIERV